MKMTAKQRGLWPETTSAFHLHPTVSVTFKIDSTLYDWLANFVGGYSFFSNVEEALVTAVRCMAGAEHPHGCDIQSLAYWLSDAKGEPTATAMYRSISSTADYDKIAALLFAAHVAAAGNYVAEWIASNDPDFAAKVKAILAAAEIQLDLDRLTAEPNFSIEDEEPDTVPPGETDYDDDIPF